mmetsp:Transcript_22849/g.20076  ORF Transcript_22849/g.20076 Transcript_22849/m.20076 type:complete len:282 (-) Transcript_22849:22-867(-)
MINISGLIIFMVTFKSINAGYGPLVVTYVNAYNLPDEDDIFSGISDPYVKIFKCSSGSCDYSSPIQLDSIDNNEDPHWRNIHVEIPGFLSDSKWNQLELQFWDYDPTSGDDHLRTVKMDIDKNAQCGVNVIKFTPDTLNTIWYNFECNLWSTLVIETVMGQNLPNEDDFLSGTSDPYVKIFLCTSNKLVCDWSNNYGASIGRKEETIHPEWSNLNIEILYQRGKWEYISVQFWDHDTSSGDDHLRTDYFYIEKFQVHPCTYKSFFDTSGDVRAMIGGNMKC